MTKHMQMIELIKREARIRGLSIRALTSGLGLPHRSLQNVLDGKQPSINRTGEICRALGLEFYIGPPRSDVAGPIKWKNPLTYKLSFPLGGVPLRDQLADLSDKLAETKAALEALAATNDDTTPAEARPIAIMEVESAAGAGAEVLSEDIKGYAWFRSSWLAAHALDPEQCVIIRVSGESMEPTLVDGASILVDRNRTHRRAGYIYVIRTNDGLVAKRLDQDKEGTWLLNSDHPKWPPIPWSNDMEIIGQILWTARTLAK